MRNILPELLPASSQIKTDVVVEPSLAGMAQPLLARIGFMDKKLLIVCDTHTHTALGERLMGELHPLKPELLTLHGRMHPDETAVGAIRLHKAGALIAVGSGTINDLCKYASFLDKMPYAVFPTAPSMNGYLSANASIIIGNVKESHPAHLPAGVFCDLKVIAGAPVRLIRSGLGDSLCRPTAQADWLLSHMLLGTPYMPPVFELLMPYEAELFAHADKLTQGDLPVVELLLKTLLVSGLGMTLAGGSYPASQGEHLIAHTMEMKHGDALPETYHGEQIGVTTLTMACIQQEALSRPRPLQLPPLPHWEQALMSYLGSIRGRRIAETTRKKYRIYDDYDALALKLASKGPEIRDAVRRISLPESRLRDVLHKAGAPTTPAELGWSDHDYDIAVSRARFIRDRFTFLDLI